MPRDGPGSSPPRASERRRDRSRSRSRSGERRPPQRDRTPPPAGPDDEPIGDPYFEVVEAMGSPDGDTWRAEMHIPRPSSNQYQKAGFMTVRGPKRSLKSEAEDDGEKMQSANKKGGMAGCRKMQVELNKGRLRASGGPGRDRDDR
mmetsp:Transcript_52167/g.149529  ORF Transcript_52167/g.149529 Transcript_52167/m.149529 type:complete len:146 (-) Transcript_52167:202-639(-)